METLRVALRVIQDVLGRHEISIQRVFLFGSRARGEAGCDSDWDFYVVVDGDPTFAQRHRAVTGIRRELARLRIPNDVILKSARQFERMKEYPGHLAYEVAQEGTLVLYDNDQSVNTVF
jgi:predicted nucleotidyltransferase